MKDVRNLAEEIVRLVERIRMFGEGTIHEIYATQCDQVEGVLTSLDGATEKIIALTAERDALLAQVKGLREALKECADGLEEYVEAYYEKTKDYPSALRRYNRDIEPVLMARKVLGGD